MFQLETDTYQIFFSICKLLQDLCFIPEGIELLIELNFIGMASLSPKF